MIKNPVLNELFALLDGHQIAAKALNFQSGEVLFRAGSPVSSVIFPTSGLIASCVALSDGTAIEVGLCGHRQIVGGAAVFGSKTHLSDWIVQVTGTGWSVPCKVIVDAAERHASFRVLLEGQEQFALIQSHQRAACNAKHNIRQRLATHLLRSNDLCGGGELDFTQAQLADLLGIQRATLSATSARFKDLGFIDYRRARLRVTDEPGLLAEACECCTVLRQHGERLLQHSLADNHAPAFGSPASEASASADRDPKRGSAASGCAVARQRGIR